MHRDGEDCLSQPVRWRKGRIAEAKTCKRCGKGVQRGRADGEVLALLQKGLENARRTKEIKEIHGEFLAIDTALASLAAGDLCLILIDQIDEALAHIGKRVAEG